MEAIDPQRIALWGTSLSGGHVITTAARDHRIACVVAQCPGNDKYRPIKYAGDVRCPVLMQICEKDEIIPVSSARATEKLLGTYADARYYFIGHFDRYKGEHFERAVEEQVQFLKKHMAVLQKGGAF